MKNKLLNLIALSLLMFFVLLSVDAQTSNFIKRTNYRTEKVKFGYAGTITILGSPEGSISIEGWNKNEVEVSADIEVQGENEEDLAILAQVNNFVLDDTTSNLRILSVGMHDKDYMKKVAKKFPKRLYAMPWRIDYRIKVPMMSDLNITSGKGDLKLSKVEGAFQIKAAEANANFILTGGTIDAVFGKANVNIEVLSRSWRGRHFNVQVATGSINVQLPQNLNAEIDAKILRTGQIENFISSLEPRDKVKFTDRTILAKAGSGGVGFAFTIGDGNLKLSQ